MGSKRKKKNNTIRNIAIISVILLVAITGSIIYKVQSANTSNTNSDLVDSSDTNEAVEGSNEEQTNDEGTDPQPGESSGGTSAVGNTDSSEGTEKPNGKSSEGTSDNKDAQNNEGNSSSKDSEAIDRVTYVDGQVAPSEPTYINGVLLVNKKYPLPVSYNNGEDPVAKHALEQMLAAGKEAGFTYEAFSGFRSYEYQTTLYDRYVKRDGKQNADRYSARPGYSEHQSGLAFDIGEANRKELWLTEQFGETEAGKWLMNNAHQYGFILRYPKGKEHITGFMYESWHYRYVGVEHATKIYEAKKTLEEYLGVN